MPETAPDHSATPPQERILDAASAIFAAHGFSGARVDEIAARAGVNKAMLYYHVGGKDALYTAVLHRNFDAVDRAIATALATAGCHRRRLEAVITAISEVAQNLPDHPRIVLREITSGGLHLPPDVLARMLEVVRAVATVLAAGAAAGEFRRLDPVLTHFTIVGAALFLNAIAPIRARAAGLDAGLALPAPESDIARFLTTTLLDGIAAPPSDPSGGTP
jgi:TetR/AcrR family transcriptional regulator